MRIAQSTKPVALLICFVAAILYTSLAAHDISAKTAQPSDKSSFSLEAGSCEKDGPKRCVQVAIAAMGGQELLENIKSLRTESMGHSALMEQSYRQDPFIYSYETVTETIDFSGRRLTRQSHITWPEADSGDSSIDNNLVASNEGGVYRTPAGDRPCSLGDLDTVREAFAINPVRVLLTALNASDLRLEPSAELRSTQHTVVAFTNDGTTIRVLINIFNNLPDAVETTSQFHDFWFYWGDVKRRFYFDNWQLFHGLRYPTNIIEERNGALWRSSQVIKLEMNPTIEDKQFSMDAAMATRSKQQKGFETPFKGGKPDELAPGISLYKGSWNSTIIKQADGVTILEAPISGIYIAGVIAEAKKLYPGILIKAVLSTSDSWPHVGGVRESVAEGLPVYILDLNKPLLERFIRAPHTIQPDTLARSPRQPDWKIVSGPTEVGAGENRMVLYPMRGASTERQYMVYFPEHKILYASDTLVINEDGSLYMPELMYEVWQAVQREGLEVKTVYAMHQGPTPWEQVVTLIEKARH